MFSLFFPCLTTNLCDLRLFHTQNYLGTHVQFLKKNGIVCSKYSLPLDSGNVYLSKQNSLCFGKISKFSMFSLTGNFLAIFPVFPVQRGPCKKHGRCSKLCLYALCVSRNFRQFTHRVAIFTADSDQQCWSHFSIVLYGNKSNFSLPYLKY